MGKTVLRNLPWRIKREKSSYWAYYFVVDNTNRTIAVFRGVQLDPDGLSIGEAEWCANALITAANEEHDDD